MHTVTHIYSGNLRHNVWILAIGNNDSITPVQALEDLTDLKLEDKPNHTNNSIKIKSSISLC